MKRFSIFKTCSFFFLAGTLLSLSCKEKANDKELFVDHFPESRPLKGMVLKEIENSIPRGILVEDSLLVLLNSMGENFFSVYDKSNMDLVGEFSKKGDGPLEFNSVDHIRGFTGPNEEQSHLIFDWKNQRMNFLNLRESIRLNSPSFTSKKIPHILSDTYRMVYYSDTLIIAVQGGHSHENAGRFKIVQGDSVKIVDYLPELPFMVHEDNFYRIYANVSSAIHPQKDKFVATTVLLGQYDFFDFDGNYLHSTVIDKDEILEKAAVAPIKPDEPITFYHTQLISADSLIYSLYSTVTREAEITKSTIHVLDWEGRPVKEYLLDYTLIAFDLDLKNNSIYGLSYSSDRDEKIHVVKFPLDKEG